MRIPTIIFVCLLEAVGAVSARPASPSGGTKPESTGAGKTSSASCLVSIDASGRKSAAMTESTGSKALDNYLMQDAVNSLNGARLHSTSIPFYTACRTIEAPAPHGKIVVRVAMPRPPYPAQARVSHEQGSGAVKVIFDKSGRAIHAEMAPSTGSKILDGNTVNYALARWKSTGGATVSVELPVNYQLR